MSQKKMPFIIVDLFNGSYNNKNIGFELFNKTPNPLDGKFYGYVPDKDNPNIEKLGAKENDNCVENVLVIFVEKLPEGKNRIITGFYPSATVYRNSDPSKELKRNFIDRDGTVKTAPYSITSEKYVAVGASDTFVIQVERYSAHMFRKQRVYQGKYPELDERILEFIDGFKEVQIDDDFEIQNDIQSASEASDGCIQSAPTRNIELTNNRGGESIKTNQQLSKTAIIRAEYTCELDHEHSTFITTRNVPYMEGHHLIPCTLKNARFIMERFGRHIDCVENIISLCPNCHRKIHFADDVTKRMIIEQLFHKQRDKLNSAGIDISIETLFELYGLHR